MNNAKYLKPFFPGRRWINNQRKSNSVWYNLSHWKIIALIIRCIFSFLSIGRQPTTWPANNCLQIMVCSCVVPSKRVLVQIIFNSCVIGTTFSREKLGSLKEATTATPQTTSLKKWIYILPTNLGILLGHLLCLSLSKLSRNWIRDTSIHLKQNFKKLAVVLHVLQTT